MEILLIIGLMSLLFGGSDKKNKKKNWYDRWHDGERKRYWNYGSMEDSQRQNSSFWG